MSRSANSDHNIGQLQLEMQAMAELLLDIYEYRLQTKQGADTKQGPVLDASLPDRTMKERSPFKPENNIE